MEITSSATQASLTRQQIEADPQFKIAKEFEASFLAEMLKYSGINKTSKSFGGGPGEEAFSSMLNQAYADALVETGGVGIAEIVYQSILEKSAETKG